MLADVSTATPVAKSQPLPPRYVEKTYDGADGFSFVTNPLEQFSVALSADWIALTVGKFGDVVSPTTTMLPLSSTAMPLPSSTALPPRYVENNNPEPVGFNLETNASCGKLKKLPVVPANKVEALEGWPTSARTS